MNLETSMQAYQALTPYLEQLGEAGMIYVGTLTAFSMARAMRKDKEFISELSNIHNHYAALTPSLLSLVPGVDVLQDMLPSPMLKYAGTLSLGTLAGVSSVLFIQAKNKGRILKKAALIGAIMLPPLYLGLEILLEKF